MTKEGEALADDGAAAAARAKAGPGAPPPRATVERPRAGELACSVLLWPCIVALPLALKDRYARVFPEAWYAYPQAGAYGGDALRNPTPSPLGLTLGLLAVLVGMVAVLAYQFARFHRLAPFKHAPISIQTSGAREYAFWEGVVVHLSNPEGFALLGSYLSGTWLLGLMPASYYSFEGGVQWRLVLAQLLMQDFVQFVMHRAEHAISPYLYRLSHKPHHRFTNPRLFDAFNGSVADTILMILVPLYTTAVCVRGVNVWSYMAFGSLYANWLTLIHSEARPAFRRARGARPSLGHTSARAPRPPLRARARARVRRLSPKRAACPPSRVTATVAARVGTRVPTDRLRHRG